MPVYSSTLGRMSQAPRRTAIALIAALTAVVMSGCGAPAPTPTMTPTALSEAEAYAAAEATYRAYVDAFNRVDLADPSTFEPVFAMTTGALTDIDRRNFSQLHADRYRLVGADRIVTVQPLEYVDERVVRLGTCIDVSTADILDSAGNSTALEGRPLVAARLATLELVDSASFKVRGVTSWETVDGCVGS